MAFSALRTAAKSFSRSPFQQSAPGEAERTFCFDDRFLGFQGHFPNHPILPAFVQVLLAQMVAEELAGRTICLAGLTKAKFLSQVRPSQEVLVRCKVRETAPVFSVEAQVLADGVRSASFLLQFSEKAP